MLLYDRLCSQANVLISIDQRHSTSSTIIIILFKLKAFYENHTPCCSSQNEWGCQCQPIYHKYILQISV
jgi:hypothetical protein